MRFTSRNVGRFDSYLPQFAQSAQMMRRCVKALTHWIGSGKREDGKETFRDAEIRCSGVSKLLTHSLRGFMTEYIARGLLLVCVMGYLGETTRLEAQTGCSPNPTPFTIGGIIVGFCQAVAAAYFTGLTNGTTATTYSPTVNVPRDQMAASSHAPWISRCDAAAGGRRSTSGGMWEQIVWAIHHFQVGYIVNRMEPTCRSVPSYSPTRACQRGKILEGLRELPVEGGVLVLGKRVYIVGAVPISSISCCIGTPRPGGHRNFNYSRYVAKLSRRNCFRRVAHLDQEETGRSHC